MRFLLVLSVLYWICSAPSNAQASTEVLRELATKEAECDSLEELTHLADDAVRYAPGLPIGETWFEPYVYQTRRALWPYQLGDEKRLTRIHPADSVRVLRVHYRKKDELLVEIESLDGSVRGFVSARAVDGLVQRVENAEAALRAVASARRRHLVGCRRHLRKLTSYVRKQERQAQAELREQELYDSTPDILIDNFDVSRPNSAAGVDLRIEWRFLNPRKTIRYIHFTARPYNRVGDVQTCRIRDYSDFTGYVTGPLEASAKEHSGDVWGTAWYNNDISCVRLTRVRVEYTDGSTYTYIRELPSILGEGVINSCTMESQR